MAAGVDEKGMCGLSGIGRRKRAARIAAFTRSDAAPQSSGCDNSAAVRRSLPLWWLVADNGLFWQVDQPGGELLPIYYSRLRITAAERRRGCPVRACMLQRCRKLSFSGVCV